ncbi:DUF3100 domain-containing protein [Sphingomonas sp. RIT328]|uniref:DUF3100 domain-containing protein n=1 Tax=Sphingomonas sp. RIT328 TaxID=1470591 RepID=UPI0005648730|nr:DUF3100 domain-containing protein [Sphingomonas sp. RIT328]
MPPLVAAQRRTGRRRTASAFLGRLLLVASSCVLAAEAIGSAVIPLGGPLRIVLLPMVWVLLIGGALGLAEGRMPRALRIDPPMQRLAAAALQPALLIFIAKSSLLVGEALPEIVHAGWSLLFQEFGHFLGTAALGLPVALMLGIKREAIGATFSVGREPSLAIIGERYGMASPEGRGVLAEYVTSTLLGTAFISLLAGFVASLGVFDPLALAMGSGLGSGSMMAAAAGAIASQQPADLARQVIAFAAAANLVTTTLGTYFTLYVSLPFTVRAYRMLEPRLGRRRPAAATQVAEAEATAREAAVEDEPVDFGWPRLFAIWTAVAAMGLIGNYFAFGEQADPRAFAGLAIVVGATAGGHALHSLSRGAVPAVATVSLVGMALAVPGMPGAAETMALTGRIHFIALGTPVMALAGLSLAKDLPAFRRLGWRIVLVSLLANAGTFLGATLIAQILQRPAG